MFNRTCSVIGAIHLPPLPGAANYGGSIDELLRSGVLDAITYKENGVDALIVENMHDTPYIKGHAAPETVAAMTIVAQAIKYETMMPVGVQILAGANLESLAAAIAAGLDFIRVEGFVFAHVGDEGIHESSAAQLIRRRFDLKADHIKIFADIKKKHSSHAITEDVSLIETAEAAEFFRADGVIVTGTASGKAAEPKDVQDVRKSVSCSVLVGSGVTKDNVHKYSGFCDALIVGTSLKEDGLWQNPVCAKRVDEFMQKFEKSKVLA